MEQPIDHIADIESEVQSKTRLYSIMLWVMLCFTILEMISLFREFRNTASWSDLIFTAVFLFFPLAALILLKIKKKAGWIIAVFYFEFITVVLCNFLYENYKRFVQLNWYSVNNMIVVTLFILSSFIMYLLLSRDLRKFLSIKKKMFLWTLIVATSINLALVILMLFY